MPIAERINGIIDRRLGRGYWEGKGRLQQIEKAEGRIEELRSKISKLQGILNQIDYQGKEKRGDYYLMLQRDSEMELRLKDVSLSRIHEFNRYISDLQMELSLLKKRFSRDCVQLAMIGRERQGKSSLIQSITNLGNEVIPAFDGTSCTGAVSIIHNIDGPFRAELTFYERGKFCEIINDKLKRYFPEKGLSVSSLDDIPGLLAILGDESKGEAGKFVTNYLRHFDEYKNLIGTSGVVLTEEALVAQYVAQYQRFKNKEDAPLEYDITDGIDKETGGVIYVAHYFKYLAVSSANIYTRFEYPDSGKLVLVDTIGIGPQDDGSIRKEMYRVLREECDGAIDVFRPDSLGNCIDDKQLEILEGVKTEFGDRLPNLWFTYVINEVREGDGKNIHLTKEILDDATENYKDSKKTQFAWAVCVCARDQQEVIEQLIIPQLNLITDNLEKIDESMLGKVREKATKLYNEYVMLCKDVNAVVTSSLKNDQNTIHEFDKLYKQLKFSSAMQALDDKKYGTNKEKPCEEIFQRLSEITEEGIFDILPDEDVILEDVDKGDTAIPSILEKYINIFRNRVFDIYESVSVDVLKPLQEIVKKDMIDILFKDGLLGNIPLAGYDTSKGPSEEWLSTIIEETIDKEVYPQLYNAFRLILDYQISIEGLIEYNVARCVHIINPLYSEYYSVPFVPKATVENSEKANQVFQAIFDRITYIQEPMRKWQNDFAMIPSHSFYARVHKVRERLFLSPEGKEQLRYYYFDNMSSVWRDDIAKITKAAKAFGEWNEMCSELNKYNEKCNFEI